MAQHGRYTVVRKLANGGMAEIFLASQQGHEGFQKPVVLKRILGAIYSDPQFRNMLIDEAHISMGLTHSNIVQVLDLGLAGGRYFLVLELVDGWDLGYVIQRAKAAGFPLPPGLGLFIVTEVCRALAYAHSRTGPDGEPLGIVHRDVSPNNVLISEHGEVKLADFGIAKAMNKREHTGTGVVKGKVAFMSPEQGMGKSIDGRSDVFSVGTLLYVVSVGVRPFDASTDLETLLRVQRAEFKPPGQVRPEVPLEVEGVITRAMKFSPDERYQTADEMLLDLERLLRSLYGGVGQTELKQYLAELGRRDGVPPIGRAQPVVEDRASASGAELREGNAVVLADAQDDVAADERTDLADFMAVDGQSGPRLTRRTMEPARVSPEVLQGQDSGAARSGRRSRERVDLRLDTGGREQAQPRSSRRMVEELSIPEGAADDYPPQRFRRKKSRALPTFLVLLVLGGGCYAVARYLGLVDQLLVSTGLSHPTAPAAPTEKPPEVGGSVRPPTSPSGGPKVGVPGTAAVEAVRGHPAAGTPSSRIVPPAAPPAPAQQASAVPPTPASERPAAVPPSAPPRTVPPSAKEVRADTASVPSKRSAGSPHAHRVPAPPARTAPSSGSRDVFKESARRVRSLSEGLDQLPPGTIQLPPPVPDQPPTP